MRIRITSLLILAALAFAPATYASYVADVSADWSDTSNPNAASFGTWSYLQGSSLLPHVADWTPLGASPQPAWAPSTTSGNYLPAIFKATSNVLDWQTGDVVVHTTDGGNGSASGIANIVWTSPFAATIDISGGVWMGRDFDNRANDWRLYRNSTLLTSGHIFHGDPYSRANPFSFSLGSGGAMVLNNISMAAGDTIRLELQRTSPPGDFVGVDWTIEGEAVQAVPEPASIALLGLASFGGCCLRLRRRQIATSA